MEARPLSRVTAARLTPGTLAMASVTRRTQLLHVRPASRNSVRAGAVAAAAV